mmetsp:Transcript_11873/g.37749  ORF Transcript_11873/g.37749 Transcript_11873/m.37749 type:complete len:245 (-) Transcript_11873:1275-2009(-)
MMSVKLTPTAPPPPATPSAWSGGAAAAARLPPCGAAALAEGGTRAASQSQARVRGGKLLLPRARRPPEESSTLPPRRARQPGTSAVAVAGRVSTLPCETEGWRARGESCDRTPRRSRMALRPSQAGEPIDTTSAAPGAVPRSKTTALTSCGSGHGSETTSSRVQLSLRCTSHSWPRSGCRWPPIIAEAQGVHCNRTSATWRAGARCVSASGTSQPSPSKTFGTLATTSEKDASPNDSSADSLRR